MAVLAALFLAAGAFASWMPSHAWLRTRITAEFQEYLQRQCFSALISIGVQSEVQRAHGDGGSYIGDGTRTRRELEMAGQRSHLGRQRYPSASNRRVFHVF